MAKSTRHSFRPRPRLMSILGEHLIRDNTVGLLELVKNGYDADATEVSILLDNLNNPNNTEIIVRDNGHGMSSDILLGPWLEPAHGGKEDKKKKGLRSQKGRLPLGEKGVGRFAVQKLGKILELVTRAVDSPRENVLRVNWAEFESNDVYLDEISVEVTERLPMVFPGGSHGTLLRMKGARAPWTVRDLQKLQRNLRRLVSPSKFGRNEFSVKLSCPEYPDIELLDPVDWLEDHYHYRFKGTATESGMIEYQYDFKLPPDHSRSKTGTNPAWTKISEGSINHSMPLCGPFSFTFYAWDRDQVWLKKVDITRDDINNICGVSIYRDGFRILPYGEPGDDWLKLDQRRINNPAIKIGNRQIVGYIELDQSVNNSLIDKTNREGLQENQSYEDLSELAIACIETLENARFNDRPGKAKSRDDQEDVGKGLKNINEIIKDVKKRTVSNSDYTEKGIINQIEKSSEDDEGPQIGFKDGFEIYDEIKKIVITREELDNIQSQVQRTSVLIASEKENRQMFMHLVGVGLAAERFKHEFDRLTATITGYVNTLKGRLNGKVGEDEVKSLDTCIRALKNELRRMGALTYIQRAERESNVWLSDVIRQVLEMNGQRFKDSNIIISGDFQLSHMQGENGYLCEASCNNPAVDLCMKMRESSLAQIFDNIIDNAIYWLTVSQTENPEICILLEPVSGRIVISNNGPSIPENEKSNIFEAFFTSKHQGTGLGLYIAREILKDVKGSIDILEYIHGKEFPDNVIFSVTLPESTC